MTQALNDFPIPSKDFSKMESTLQELESSGLSSMTLKELLGEILSSVAQSERKRFLEQQPQDKANGFYERGLGVGSLPLQVQVPRVRSGEFRPAILPEKHQRIFPEEQRELLLSLLLSSRSKNAAKQSLARLGLPYSEEQMDQISAEVLEEFKLKNTAPLDPDLLAVWLDAKFLEVKEGQTLKPYTTYLLIGLTLQGKKRILACLVEEGRESLEGWKKALRSLFERGLRRVLLIVQDDFSGLSKLIQGFFPQSLSQLCTVHLLRNVLKHLSKEDAKIMTAQLQATFKAYDVHKANADFDDILKRWKDHYPSFIDCLEKKRELYLNFLNFPKRLRPTLATTNIVEGINRIFEKIRLNSSGYFHSTDDLKMKLGFSIQSLEQGKWKSPAANVRESLQEMVLLFQKRFGEDSVI